MILSRRHKYIFLHCPKTAGSSTTISLARSLGPRDIQIGALHETIAYGVAPTAATALRLATYSGFRHFARGLVVGNKFAEAFNAGVKVSFRQSLGVHPEHCSSRVLRQAFPVEWENFFKFCVVRNPYDKAVSYYYWTTKNFPTRPTFSEFAARFYKKDCEKSRIKRFADNWPIYTINDQIAVDRILRFENIVDDLHDTLKDIGVAWDGWMPQVKTESRGVRDYRKLYRDEDIEVVTKFFQKEIDAFGYSFD